MLWVGNRKASLYHKIGDDPKSHLALDSKFSCAVNSHRAIREGGSGLGRLEGVIWAVTYGALLTRG